MKTDNLDDIWSGGEDIGSDSQEALQIVRRERVRDIRRKIRMGLFGFNLTAATAFATWVTVSGKSHPGESWPATVSLLALWATYLEFLRFRRNESHRLRLLGEDVRSALQLALDKARARSREIRILLAVNLLAVIPMTVASVQNLLGNGKMTPDQAVGFALFSGAVFGANIVFLSLHYFVKLRPRCQLLRDRIASLEG